MALSLIYTPTDAEINAIATMSNDDRADLANGINANDPFAIFDSVVGKEGKQIICPFCGSGTHGNKNTGIKPSLVNGIWLFHCFASNDCEGTLLNIIAQANNLSTRGKDFFQVLAIAANILNISFEVSNLKPARKTTKKDSGLVEVSNTADKTDEEILKTRQEQEQNEKLAELIQADIENGKACLLKLPKKEKRGLTDETLKTFKIGVNFNWTPPQKRLQGETSYSSPRVIIPHLLNSALPQFNLTYCAALFQAERERLDTQGKEYLKYLYGGNRTPFGLNTLTPDAEYIAITEGEFDALSIWQAIDGKYPCLATGGTADNGLIDALNKFYPNKKTKIIIFADNENAGIKFANTMCEKFIQHGFSAVYRTFADSDSPKLDANKILVEQGNEKLAEIVTSIIALAQDDLKRADDSVNRQKENLEKLSFITDEHKRNDFIKLQNSPPSKGRNKAMAQIILENLDWKIARNGKRLYPLATALNFHRIFNCDPVIADLFAYEEFKDEIVFLRQPYWRKTPYINSQWTDSDDAAIRVYLRENYADLSSKFTIDDMFSVISQENAFNVVKNHLEKLPAWDGQVRAETLFIKFLKVNDDEFARAVTMKWLLAAVARIFYPGCNFQAALVLQGNQNIGKSYILEKLGGVFYGALSDSLDDTHAIDAIKILWIVEMKEFSAARKAEINAVKSFIERSADNHRAPYARRAKTFKRHSVFAITVNDAQFLRDQTGNRRYWILESPLAEFGYIDGLTDEYIQQIWAEVLFKFKELTKDGFNDKILELPLNLKIQAETTAEKFTYNDGLINEIAAFLDVPILPPVLWNVLTKDEKQKFFDKGYIELDDGDWQKRKEFLKTAYEKLEFENAIDAENKFVRTIEIPRGKDVAADLRIAVYGSYTRQETCASEIYNECFGRGDRRKQIGRINEVLKKLDDIGQWKKTGRQAKNFNGYGHQSAIYCRLQSKDIAENSGNNIEPAPNSKTLAQDSNYNFNMDDTPLPF